MTIPSNAAQAAKDDPSTRSGDRGRMDKHIDLISTILEGAQAVRERSDTYLFKYQGEDDTEYKRRLKSAPWRPIFEDALRTLASKPFEEDIAFVGDKVPDVIKELSEDVDGQGNNITQFAGQYFEDSVAFGVSLLFVDFPNVKPGATIQEEREANVRPYWIMITAKDVVALHLAYEGGKEVVTHLRYRECVTVLDGFEEKEVHRIREYNVGSWRVWEQNDKTKKWDLALDASGQPMQGTISRGRKGKKSIPVVPLFTGKRKGALQALPPLLSLADMQMELYRALSQEEEILTFASAPMLTANGMGPPKKGPDGKPPAPIVAGPKTVLYAPSSSGSSASWDYINPNPGNIEQVRKKVNDIQDDMRRVGMQPLTPGSGTQTATGQSIEASKAHSAVKSWALRLKDCLEQAEVFTCEWLNLDTEVELSVFTDFDVMPFAQAPLTALKGARDGGDLSQRSYWEGLRRFDVLPHDFDAEDEEDRIALESGNQDLEEDDGIDPVSGQPVKDVPDIDPSSMEDSDDLSDEQLRALFGDTLFDSVVGE